MTSPLFPGRSAVQDVIDEDLHSMPYEARLDRLAGNRIGLWDVFGSAERAGSLDQAIRDANHNRVDRLLHDYADLEAIAFNGGKSASIGRRLIGEATGVTLIELPSSSPANTRPFAGKGAAWARLSPFCGPPSCAAAPMGQDVTR